MDLKTANHAFVTGGASGLDLGIADALAARGLRIERRTRAIKEACRRV